MPFTEVGSGSQRATTQGGSVGSVGLAFPANVTAGSLLIVIGSASSDPSDPSPIAVTDSLGTTYTVVESGVFFGSQRTFIARGIAGSSGANTVTVNPATATSWMSFTIDEFASPNATPLDVDGSYTLTGTPGTAASDSLTTLTADDLIVGVMSWSAYTTETATPNGSYTLMGAQLDNNLYAAHSAIFYTNLTNATGSYSPAWTLGSSQTWIAQTMAFKPTVAGRTTKNTRSNPLGISAGMARRMII